MKGSGGLITRDGNFDDKTATVLHFIIMRQYNDETIPSTTYIFKKASTRKFYQIGGNNHQQTHIL